MLPAENGSRPALPAHRNSRMLFHIVLFHNTTSRIDTGFADIYCGAAVRDAL